MMAISIGSEQPHPLAKSARRVGHKSKGALTDMEPILEWAIKDQGFPCPEADAGFGLRTAQAAGDRWMLLNSFGCKGEF